MNYMRGFKYIRDREKWVTNVLLGTVCLLIPVIGQIVFTGYMFEVVESLLKDPERKKYPDFDFNRFTEFLSRGVWPWLAQFLFGLIISIPLTILGMVVLFASIAVAHGKPWGIIVGELFMFLVIVPLSMLLSVVIWGPEFHAGMTKQFQFGPMIEFGKSFFSKLKREMIITGLVLVGFIFVAMILMIVTCYIAAFFIGPVFMYAKYHWLLQMYELYLQRGGKPITPSDAVPTAEPG